MPLKAVARLLSLEYGDCHAPLAMTKSVTLDESSNYKMPEFERRIKIKQSIAKKGGKVWHEVIWERFCLWTFPKMN